MARRLLRNTGGSGSPCSRQDSTILRATPCAISTVSEMLRPSATSPGTSGLVAKLRPFFRPSTRTRIAASSTSVRCSWRFIVDRRSLDIIPDDGALLPPQPFIPPLPPSNAQFLPLTAYYLTNWLPPWYSSLVFAKLQSARPVRLKRHCPARLSSFTSFASLTYSKPFIIRTYETPLPQLLYNPHLQAPLGSAGNKGLITPLESALTKNSPVSLLES